MHIKTERLFLREPTLEDSKMIFEFVLRNKNHFEKWDPIREEEYYSNKGQLLRIEKYLNGNDQVKFYIFKKRKTSKIIGEIGLSNISRGVFQNCNIGYKLDREEVGKGYMQESITAVEKFVFEKLKLHRIEANIIPRNERSIKLVERLGYRKEGLSKGLLKINGEWEDHYRYALLKDEFKEI